MFGDRPNQPHSVNNICRNNINIGHPRSWPGQGQALRLLFPLVYPGSSFALLVVSLSFQPHSLYARRPSEQVIERRSQLFPSPRPTVLLYMSWSLSRVEIIQRSQLRVYCFMQFCQITLSRPLSATEEDSFTGVRAP